MNGLLAQTIPLSFAAAISPLVLMGMLAILGHDQGKRRGIAYAIGVVGAIVGILLAGLALIGRQQGDGAPGPLGSNTAHLIVGAALILCAAAMVRPTHHDAQQQAEAKHRQWIKPNAPLIAYVVLGVVIMVVNFSTIIMLIAILHGVARAGQGLAANLVALGLAAVIASLPATAPLAVDLFGGARAAAEVERVGGWTTSNGKYILAALFLVFGLQDVLQALGH